MTKRKQPKDAELNDEAASDNTEEKQSGLIPFKPGQSGNPSGRPKGSRSRISEKFLTKLEDIFDRRGDDALEKAVTANPMKFIQLVAGLLPARLEARLEGMIEHRHVDEFDAANGINDILNLVAREAGIEGALILAKMFDVEYSPPRQIEALPRANRSHNGK
jgi:hypothetical protein